jgi:hypothetical protein
MLQEHEAAGLLRATSDALRVISPVFPLSDPEKWGERLQLGAGVNVSDAIAIGHCYDVALGFGEGRIMPRPDRYFGLPFRELTEGQWFLYRACRAWVEKRSSKGERKKQ